MTLNTPAKRLRIGSKTWVQAFTLAAQSPDLNPIEHLWDHLKRRLESMNTPKGGIGALERVEKEWEGIGASVCQNLIESMPRRVNAVIKAKGGYTKY